MAFVLEAESSSEESSSVSVDFFPEAEFASDLDGDIGAFALLRSFAESSCGGIPNFFMNGKSFRFFLAIFAICGSWLVLRCSRMEVASSHFFAAM